MAENYGWVGKILRVNLTTGQLTDIPTSNYAPKFIGGRMMSAKIYWDEVPPEVKAFDPENKLIITQGPVNGTVIPFATRTSVVTKSPIPVPECYYYSSPGSHWGPTLKFAGYDGIIVEGKSPEPVYLWIHDGQAEIRKAGFLWGTVTSKADQEFKRLHGYQAKTMVIGPAGENLVKEAVIELEGHAATGIGGFGSVMGSKNLKAIVVRGTGSVKVAKPKELIELRQSFINDCVPLNIGKILYGTGYIPFPTHLRDAVKKGEATFKNAGCWGCMNQCQVGMRFKNIDVQSGIQTCNEFSEMQQDDFTRTGKYQTTDSWEFGRLCDDLGISATQIIGHTIPWFKDLNHGGTWAWELLMAGLWTEENTGLPVGTKENSKVGSKEFNRALLHKVAYREGIGNLIAEGQQRYLRHVVETAPAELKQAAQEIYDRNIWAENYHALWQPRHVNDGLVRFMDWAVGMGGGPSGALAQGLLSDTVAMLGGIPIEEIKNKTVEMFGDIKARDDYVPEGKPAVVIYVQHLAIEADSLTSCLYGNFVRVKTLELGPRTFSATTGEDNMALNDWLKQVGERGYNLERAILVREGRRRKHDTMNDYHLTEARWPMPDGPCVSRFINKDLFKNLMDEYYKLRGWDLDTGIPSRSKLEELGLKDVADDLENKYGVTVPA